MTEKIINRMIIAMRNYNALLRLQSRADNYIELAKYAELKGVLTDCGISVIVETEPVNGKTRFSKLTIDGKEYKI